MPCQRCNPSDFSDPQAFAACENNRVYRKEVTDRLPRPMTPECLAPVKSYGLVVTVEELAEKLRQAAEAHHDYEAANGPDEDWPSWYARHILGEVA